jgi:hypothetical protein
MTERDYLLIVSKERIDAARTMLASTALVGDDSISMALNNQVKRAHKVLDEVSARIQTYIQRHVDIDSNEKYIDVTRIDRHNYPAIFTLCAEILQDNGGSNRVDTPNGIANLKFLLPAHPASGFGHMEAAAYALTAEGDDFQQFATGEDTVVEKIAARDPHLQQLHGILNAWFDLGMPTE